MSAENSSGKNKIATLAKQFTPKPISIYLELRKNIREGKDKENAVKQAKRDVAVYIVKVAASAAIYQGVARSYGVGAWNLSGAPISNSVVDSASSVAVTFGKGVDHAIPPEIKHALAAAIVPIEMGISVGRAFFEQWIWNKIGMSADPAGVISSPAIAIVLETLYKSTQKYAVQDDERLTVALIGIWGNAMRVLDTGLIYLAYRAIESKLGRKKDQDS